MPHPHTPSLLSSSAATYFLCHHCQHHHHLFAIVVHHHHHISSSWAWFILWKKSLQKKNYDRFARRIHLLIFHSLLARASLVATFGTWRKETKKGEIRSVKKSKKKMLPLSLPTHGPAHEAARGSGGYALRRSLARTPLNGRSRCSISLNPGCMVPPSLQAESCSYGPSSTRHKYFWKDNYG